MNKNLKEVLPWKNCLEFFLATLFYCKKYNVLVKLDCWKFHNHTSQVGLYFNDAFYPIACKAASLKNPHLCNSFDGHMKYLFYNIA